MINGLDNNWIYPRYVAQNNNRRISEIILERDHRLNKNNQFVRYFGTRLSQWDIINC